MREKKGSTRGRGIKCISNLNQKFREKRKLLNRRIIGRFKVKLELFKEKNEY